MMRKAWKINPILLFFLVGCGPAPRAAAPVPSVAPSVAPNYYPLRQGGTFTYYHRENGLLTGTLSLAFKEVSKNANQTVAQVERKLNLTSGSPPTSLDRVIESADTIDFASFLDNGSIYNRFVLPFEVGKVWYFATPEAEHTFTVKELTDTLTPMQNFRNCAHIVDQAENNLVESQTDYWLAPGIGLVRYRFRQTIKGEHSPYLEIIDELQSFE